MPWIQGLTWLLSFQLLGELSARVLQLPIPGPVIGMALLLLLLLWRQPKNDALTNTANGLLTHLSLLFIPAGVGLMTYGALLQQQWQVIVVSLVITTVMSLVFTAGIMHAAQRWLTKPGKGVANGKS